LNSGGCFQATAICYGFATVYGSLQRRVNAFGNIISMPGREANWGKLERTSWANKARVIVVGTVRPVEVKSNSQPYPNAASASPGWGAVCNDYGKSAPVRCLSALP
jgi:hypothetical protein